jgi:predicted transcriptional regulator
MSLGDEKMRILELLWAEGQPMTLKDVAQKCGLKVAATNMHLLGLKRAGHVITPKHGYYAITESGKDALGLPKVDKALASKILSHVSTDKAFHFYTGIHQYTHVIAHDLAEFTDKVQKIDVKAIEFHIPRKDIEHWIQSLGDTELAKRLAWIRSMRAHGEDLRTRVYETVKHRLDELKRIHG